MRWPGRGAALCSPGLGELIDLALHPVALVTEALLELADELVPPASDLIQVVVGQLAPLLSDLSAELLPVARHLVPTHHRPPSWEYPPGLAPDVFWRRRAFTS